MISGIGGSLGAQPLFGAKPTGETQGGEGRDVFTGKTEEVNKSPEEDFLDYARMSVAERIRAQFLQDEKLTEEKLRELDAKQRERIEEKIREAIEEKIAGETGKTVGGIADLVA
jgi:hypothetical protein